MPLGIGRQAQLASCLTCQAIRSSRVAFRASLFARCHSLLISFIDLSPYCAYGASIIDPRHGELYLALSWIGSNNCNLVLDARDAGHRPDGTFRQSFLVP